MRAVFAKYKLEYRDIDIIGVPENYVEMVEKSGQRLSPCVELLDAGLSEIELAPFKVSRTAEGVMLADISGEEVEQYLITKGLVKPVDAACEVPTNSGCSDAEHAKMQAEAAKPKTIRFF